MGIELDQEKNENLKKGIREINIRDAQVKILVTPTNEELEISRQTFELLK